MNNNKIKLMVFDIDGTLIPYGKKHVPARAKNLINKLQQNGVKLAIATGRTKCFLQKSLLSEIKFDYVSCINGHCLLDSNLNPIVEHKLSLKQFNDIVKVCKKYDVALGFKYLEAVVVYNRYNDFKEKYVNNNNLYHLIIDDTENISYHKSHSTAYGAFIFSDEKTSNKIKKELDNCVLASAYKGAYEIHTKHFNKATSIKDMIKLLNIKIDNVMAFGDADNDIEMLKSVKMSITFENGSKTVKQISNYIFDDVTNNGLYKALKYHLDRF